MWRICYDLTEKDVNGVSMYKVYETEYKHKSNAKRRGNKQFGKGNYGITWWVSDRVR